jgi:hypothetical protein
MDSESNAKKVPLSIYLGPAVKQAIRAHARREGRSPSNLCDRLLEWSVKFLEQAGDSNALMSWECHRGGQRKASRVSPEMQDQLHAALDILLERAPSTVIEKVSEFVMRRAGKHGYEK